MTTRPIHCPICGESLSIPAEIPGTYAIPIHRPRYGSGVNACAAVAMTLVIEWPKCPLCGKATMENGLECLTCFCKRSVDVPS